MWANKSLFGIIREQWKSNFIDTFIPRFVKRHGNSIAFSGNLFMFGKILQKLSNRSISEGDMESRTASVRNQVAMMLVVNGLVFFLLHLPVSLMIKECRIGKSRLPMPLLNIVYHYKWRGWRNNHIFEGSEWQHIKKKS